MSLELIGISLAAGLSGLAAIIYLARKWGRADALSEQAKNAAEVKDDQLKAAANRPTDEQLDDSLRRGDF